MSAGGGLRLTANRTDTEEDRLRAEFGGGRAPGTSGTWRVTEAPLGEKGFKSPHSALTSRPESLPA